MEGKAYFEKGGMGLLCLLLIAAAVVMEYMYLGELRTYDALVKPYWSFWDHAVFAWTHSLFFKLWLGCIVLSIVTHPVCGGMAWLLVLPIAHLFIAVFGLFEECALVSGPWGLFNLEALKWLSLSLLALILPVILVGAIEDVSREMEEEMSAEEKQELQRELRKQQIEMLVKLAKD